MKLALEIGIDRAKLETEEGRLEVAAELMEGAAHIVSTAVTEILLYGETDEATGKPRDLSEIFEGVTA